MFGRRFTIFRLLGFAVRVDASWPILAALIVSTLALGYFPMQFPDLTPGMYWWMGLAGALGLFASIILHELAHAVMARRYGIPMKGITLFIFGGVAEMDEEPSSAIAEFRMAIAGPMASMVVGGLCFLIYAWADPQTPELWAGVFGYLAMINVLLAVFNLLPAFPLDGGRVLRSYLWARRNDLRSATRTASRWGAGFGAGLMGFGGFNILFGNIIGGVWWILIGLFLRNASQLSYRQLEMKQMLAGVPVTRFMRDPEGMVPPMATLQDLIDEYFHRYYANVFPVTEGSRVIGCTDVRRLKEYPRREWPQRRVIEITDACAESNAIDSSTDALAAMTRMSHGATGWLMVIDEGRLRGIVTLQDLLHYIALEWELDGTSPPAAGKTAAPLDEPAVGK